LTYGRMQLPSSGASMAGKKIGQVVYAETGTCLYIALSCCLLLCHHPAYKAVGPSQIFLIDAEQCGSHFSIIVTVIHIIFANCGGRMRRVLSVDVCTYPTISSCTEEVTLIVLVADESTRRSADS
jgi:hypothetical protein